MPTLFPFYLNVAAKVTLSDRTGVIQFDVENLDGEGLLMEWVVERMLTPEGDQGSMRIFNLGKIQQGLIQAIIKAGEGFASAGNIKVSIGWDGIAFELIDAQIWKIKPEVFEGPDVVTEIEFGDGTISSRDSLPLLTAFTDAEAVSVLSLLAARFQPARVLDIVQVQQAIADSPNRLRLLGNWDGSGEDARDQFSSLVAGFGPDFSWGYGARGLIVIYNRGLLTSQATTIPEILQPDTGLLKFTIEDNGSVSATGLANPSVVPGVSIAIKDRFKKAVGQEFMRVWQVTFAGNTNGDSTMDLVARPLGGI